ncbi:stage VI sporulation protein F [Halobacillus yeomjeoni]|uniref:Stage VI sporulation protein F n=1 Tax=Halobacillus yeomjeoni TaxID=311194 RepID=A0A931HTS9_9BACI|nr:stage VI sporulation protein F [Halobacillus yeomjeoni]MBH0229420.1 stage VI sporulation protein F [Halobacillus yeomjeoni]
MFSKMFGNLEKKTGVKMEEVMKLAQSLNGANFKDEKTVRNVIKKVAKLANKPVSKEKEEMLVKAIITGKVPKDLADLEKMTKKKK